MFFVGHVDNPQERRRMRRAAGQTYDVFIGYHHQFPVIDLERHLEGGMRWPWKRRTPVVSRNKFRLCHVFDVENHEAAPPIARVQPVSDAQRMMATMTVGFPRCLLAARLP